MDSNIHEEDEAEDSLDPKRSEVNEEEEPDCFLLSEVYDRS